MKLNRIVLALFSIMTVVLSGATMTAFDKTGHASNVPTNGELDNTNGKGC